MTPAPDSKTWGVRPAVPVACAVLCVAFAGWLVVADSPEDRLVAGAGVGITAVAAALLVTMRQRLVADRTGLTVRGPGGARTVDWHRVVGIDAPSRRRRGIAATAVELDLDNDGLIVLGRVELGADPVDVAAELRQWWRPGQPDVQLWK